MPWSETSSMDERLRFVVEAERGEEFFRVLCARFGIQPKTGYKWLRRFEARGMARPGGALAAAASVADGDGAGECGGVGGAAAPASELGAKNSIAVLRERHPALALPAASTAAAILKREELIRVPRRRVVRAHPGRPVAGMLEPNAVWTADLRATEHRAMGCIAIRSRSSTGPRATFGLSRPLVRALPGDASGL